MLVSQHDNTTNASAQSGVSGQATGTSTRRSEASHPAAAPKVVFGPAEIEIRTSAYGQDVELDTAKPMVEETIKGADLTMTSAGDGITDSAKFFGKNATHTLAPLPSSSADATEAECTRSLQKNATMEVDGLVQGRRLCVRTDEGRTAYIQVVSSPPGGHAVKIALTVWDTRS
ncbi:hypothetical protein [Streptomyces violascens]|uniref:hypothetical protein n=1 Tax=Streptomyces violascens TaxID=67381 RepID=UPI001CFCEABC|nr:hypothetical protein [Streptomyces violascens]